MVKSIDRRKFIAGTGAAALTFSIVKPEQVRGSVANSKLELGLIGCGGRGKWIAKLFEEHEGYRFTAGADYFQDKIDVFQEQFNIEKTRCFTGLDGYKRLLDSKVDAIVVQSPPYFHPMHAAAGVEAGVHVYLAKPVAVDVPGTLSVEKSGKKATEKGLVFLVDFQTRAHEYYQEAVKRVQFGDIGPIVSGEASYFAGITWGKAYDLYKQTPLSAENRLRGWGLDQALSGDVITEQNIHALDVASWILDAHPESAIGTCGRNRKYGDCNDHFSVMFTFPGNVVVTFNSKQFGKGYDDILCRMYGTRGTLDTHYFGSVSIQGDKPYKGGELGHLYKDGAVSNIADFQKFISSGQTANTTVPASVRSNLTTILGRTAAYQKKLISWQEMMTANEELIPDLAGL